jgi:agmatine/peptidylarginine deiminase
VNPASDGALGQVHMFDEYREPGVVVIAVSDETDDPLLKVQMQMLELLTDSGPVLVAVADNESRNRVSRFAQRNKRIQAALRRGTVRILEVEHTGPWIRDYGPQIGMAKDGVLVLDAEYSDARTKRQFARMQAKIDRERLSLIHQRENLDNKLNGEAEEGEDGDSESDGQVPEVAWYKKDQIDDRLSVLAQKKDVYSDHGIIARDEDDESPFFLAQASFYDTAFRLIPTGISLDGGNLMRLSGDVCALTTDVVPSNKENSDIDHILRDVYHCSKVLYLAPLPGPVIKHVDMFMMPAGHNVVLLASYDPHETLIQHHWQEADEETRDLTMEAALAMDRNAAMLTRSGFRVVRVPAPLPRVDVEYGVYFPTNLNALVRRDAQARATVLVPTYQGYQEDIQGYALSILRNTLRSATIEPMEATEAGRRQGAVHCLSLVIPQQVTMFADAQNSRKWTQWANTTARMADEQRTALERLTGLWRFQDGALVRFDGDGNAMIVDDSGLTTLKYRMRNGGRQLEFASTGNSVQSYAVEWGQGSQLVLVNGEGRIPLTRVVVRRRAEEESRSSSD